jgi:hypothetical protein
MRLQANGRLLAPFTLAALLAGASTAQYGERPDLVGSGGEAVDASGRSVKNKRVRAVHSDDPADVGSTAYFVRKDPWLAYQLGRNINYREFRERDGVFGPQVSQLGGPMPDPDVRKITANNQVSCLGCHNQPNGNPGGAANFAKDSGRGRNSPHYFGAGIVEMLAIQTRAKMLLQVDTDASGWISAAEAQAFGGSVLVSPAPGAPGIDYGDPSLTGGATGSPQLNNIFRVWYVDASGVRVPGATEVDGVTTFGYNFDMIVWGWGQGPGRSALNPTNRAFLWDPFTTHGGLQAHDPSTADDPDGDGVSLPTLSGAIQFPATHLAPDGGSSLDPLGFSLDDPDGDGHLTEISEGDLDLGEFFMLNAPRPAFAGSAQQYVRAVQVMSSMGCTGCHTASWKIEAENGTFAGDRRFFDLATRWNSNTLSFQGRVNKLYTKRGDEYVPNRGAFLVLGMFSDLRHHDMGEGFKEIGYDGVENTIWRTPMLWGVGSGFPWGHDGASLTLEDAILRHTGEGNGARLAYLAASPANRNLLIDSLRRMRLYDIESLATDMDGNGAIEPNFVVAGVDTGPERFNPEWLFETPVQIQGFVSNFDGVNIRSFAAVNLDAAYGQLLPFRADDDDDGWPNVWDNAPASPGYRDGVN